MLVIREAIVKTDQLRLVGDLNNLATSEIQAEGIGALGVARTQRRYADGEKYLNEVSEFAGELSARQREQADALSQAYAAMLRGGKSLPAHNTGISVEYFSGKIFRPRGDRNIANRCLGLVRGLPPPHRPAFGQRQPYPRTAYLR